MTDVKESASSSMEEKETEIVKLEEEKEVEDFELYLSSKTHLPVRIVHGSDMKGKMINIVILDISDWKLDVDLPASTFDPTPPAGAQPEQEQPRSQPPTPK